MSQAPKNGDRVRITYETEYVPGLMYLYGVPRGAVIEVLKPKPKVGDEVRGGEAYASLPVGTVVAWGYGTEGVYLVRVVGGWIDTDHPDLVADEGAWLDPRTIVYLPE